ncbi:MAG: hypothetical protein CM15mV25_1400 [uncultured marine virus]|nr:MAG: hypothetical protein CM15mV25_1400 [uncultured marine virus]
MDVNGHTLIHSHTGYTDVDITQSGVNDNMITLTTSERVQILISPKQTNMDIINIILFLIILYANISFYN